MTWACALRFSYVSLCDNEKTGCKARELKSVYVDAVGQFLKLIFHENHVNKYNIYNQVRRASPCPRPPSSQRRGEAEAFQIFV